MTVTVTVTATIHASALALVGLLAASVPQAPQDDGVYAITGARIVTLAGEPIENGTVVIRGGRISEVGSDVAIPAGAEILDAAGLEVYPGIMDSVSQLGLTEVGSTAATVDTTELGDFNPQLEAATAVHPASEHIPVARANGVTHALSVPGRLGGFGGGGFGIAGRASLINLSGWTVEEMALDTSVGMVLLWPTLDTRSFDPQTFQRVDKPFSEVKKAYDEHLAELADWMEAARRYQKAGAAAEKDWKLEALAEVVTGELPFMIKVDDARGIRDAVAFGEREGVRVILLSARESWKEKALLAEKGIPVILGPTLALPEEEDDPYDRPFTTAGELQAAGVKVVFASFDSSDSRLLPHEVGNAVAYGLPHEEGLKGITLYPAQLFGFADQLGSIEEGKIANLIVTTGDPLEIKTEVKYLFINGALTSLDNKHLQLYEKYRAR